MKLVSRKYLFYLILSSIMLIIWTALIFHRPSGVMLTNKIVMIVEGGLIFLFAVVLQIYSGIGNLVDLDIGKIKDIWWSRVIILVALSFIVSYITVYRNGKIDDIIKIVINSAAFGIVLGYGLKKIEEKTKLGEEGRQSILNLQVEITDNNFKCKAMLKNWQPLFLQTFVWDNLKLTKHFRLLWKKEDLTNKLLNLYLAISSANFMINAYHIASYNIIHSPGQITQDIAKKAQDILIDVLKIEVLPKLEDMEKELTDFCKTLT